MKKLNNKGFSLVELIVVIAIMAILVGVLAPSVLGQLDKAKASKDKQAFDAVASAVAYAYADQDVTTGKPSVSGTISLPITFGTSNVVASGSANTSSFNDVVLNMVGYSAIALESNEFKGKTPTVSIDTVTGKVTLTCQGNTQYASNHYTVTK